MTNELVSFKMAHQLAEAGFNELCGQQYGNDSKTIYTDRALRNSELDVNSEFGTVAAPTCMEALKWIISKQTELYTMFGELINESNSF